MVVSLDRSDGDNGGFWSAPDESLTLLSVRAGSANVFGRRLPHLRRHRGTPTVSLSLQLTEFLWLKTLHYR